MKLLGPYLEYTVEKARYTSDRFKWWTIRTARERHYHKRNRYVIIVLEITDDYNDSLDHLEAYRRRA